jgi:fumarylpyruvate hydrolase
MTDFAIPLWEQPSLPVVGDARAFPVRRVFCVGRNYADAAYAGDTMPYPVATADVHPECEMIVALEKGGRDIAESPALDCVFGYGVGLDVTRRDMQSEAKKMARPWALSKGFDAAAPCSPLHRASETGHIDSGTLRFTVNGETRQESDLNKMIWSVPETIAYLSGLITLLPGDIIMTGL